MTDEQKKILERKLWNIADTLRGHMNADEFRDYILGFIFYKYLSETMTIFANEQLEADEILYTEIKEDTENGKAYLDAIQKASVESLGYFLKPSHLFSHITEKGGAKIDEKAAEEDEEWEPTADNFILEDLTTIFKDIQKSTTGTESEDDFDHLFEDLDLTSTKLGKSEEDKNALIAKIMAHLNGINFNLKDSEADVLGDAYEYLIGQFASGAGKKAGEFYTPQQVSKILAKLVTTGKSKLKSVYDPTCGSGSLLLRVARELGYKYNNKDVVGDFYGQELNRTTYNLARMNMILHNVHYRQFDIKRENTLERPQHMDKKFEAIVANPPFSAKWSASQLHLNDDRFSQYGKLAPASKADFAFIQHMVHHLDDNGQMAVVMPHGVLFRGSAEGHIRRYLIEDCNYLDAVIGLPANIFYGTSIPTCILVFKKCRTSPNDILFIDASQGFEKAKNQNFLRETDINKIIDTYAKREAIEKYSYVASMAEIKENDYNLNIPRYVDTFEEEEPVDLKAVTSELKALDASMKEVDATIESFCKQLGIEAPF